MPKYTFSVCLDGKEVKDRVVVDSLSLTGAAHEAGKQAEALREEQGANNVSFSYIGEGVAVTAIENHDDHGFRPIISRPAFAIVCAVFIILVLLLLFGVFID